MNKKSKRISGTPETNESCLLYKVIYSYSKGFFLGTEFVHQLSQTPQAFHCFLGTIELSYVLCPPQLQNL